MLAALAALLAVGLITALILARNGGSTQRQATGASTAATPTSTHVTSTHAAKPKMPKAKTSRSETRSSPTSKANTAGTQRSSPRTAHSTTTGSSATVSANSTTTATVAGTGLPSANDSVQAVNDYYALLPGDTDTAWSRLTSQYQADHARGRQNFQAFWDAIAGVTVANTSALGPGRVQATISYRYRNGSVVDEVTAFDLVRQGGTIKIAGTSVLSSTRR